MWATRRPRVALAPGVPLASLAWSRGSRYKAVMSDQDDVLPKPEPKEIDEKLSIQLRHLAEDAVLRGQPNDTERCDNCLYYMNPDEKISYCWHPKLRILVGASWWCQWWEKIEE
jgi:hypothetical protein